MENELYKEIVYVSFPKEIINNQRSFEFFMEKVQFLQKIEMKVVLFDFSYTKYFETNLLVILSYIFEELEKRKNNIQVKLRNQNLMHGSKVIHKIFSYYSVDRRPFFKVRHIGICNSRETEDVLVKYLREINLREYNIVKIEE